MTLRLSDTRSRTLLPALCPTITPYDWQIDLAEALTLGLDATVIAGTGSGKILPWAMPLLLEENCDRICLVHHIQEGQSIISRCDPGPDAKDL